MLTRKEILDIFQMNQTLKVVFTKKDGSVRTMICTRNMGLIPAAHHPKGEGKVNDAVVPVFDLEAQGWRSFQVESVISIEDQA